MKTRHVCSFVMAVLLLSALFASLSTLSSSAAQSRSLTQASGMKRVVFRDDDIAPFGQLDTLKAVNQVHVNKNVPATMAVIPHPDVSYSGNELLADNNTLHYLRTLAINPLFEIAQHGYSHHDNTQSVVGGDTPRMFGTQPYEDQIVGAATYSEFRGRSYSTQYNTIKTGRDDVSTALGVTPKTFVPPWNSGDTNTLKACTALGFTLYCTGPDDFGVTDATLSGIHVQAATIEFGWNNLSDWQTNMPKITSQTDSALNSASPGSTLVILYHYWYFNNSDGAPDPARIALFEQYIDHLKSRGDVQFSTLNGDYTPAASSAAVFTEGPDSALWTIQRNGADWSAWTSLGGNISSSPAAVSWSDGRTDVFAAVASGTLLHRWNDGAWSKGESLGGKLAPKTGPAASSWGSGRLDVFIVGTDNRLWHKSYQNGWSGWESLGGTLTSSPAAVSWGSGRIDVAVRGSDGAVWHKWYQNGWSKWESLGGSLASGTGPAVSSWGSGRLDVFAVGSNNAIWQRFYQNGWSGWSSRGGVGTSSPGAISSPSKQVDVFVRGTNGALWEESWNGKWQSWTSLGGKIAAGTGPAACL